MTFKSAALTCLGLLCCATAAHAQDANPMTAAIKAQHDLIKSNVVKAAAKMDEDTYSFAPTPEVRTLARLFGHIANANYMICSAAAGEKNPSTANVEQTATTKADIAKALEASFAYCDGVYAKLTDAAGAEKVKFFLGEQPKLAVLAFNNAHNMEHYGNVVTYMRIKGVVPPSSEGR
jgi:uncharacterized damage-inducible protein DinB